MFLRIALLCVACQVLVLASESCRLPQGELDRLFHYEAWCDYWMGTKYGGLQRQDFKILQDGTTWIVYLIPARTLFRLSDSRISLRTCSEVQDWSKCLAESGPSLTASTISDLLLGRVRPSGSLDIGKVCTSSIEVAPDKVKWFPSGDSPRKREVLTSVSSTVLKSLKFFGDVQSVVFGDFNVRDPEIWGLTTVRDTAGHLERLLLGIEFSAGSPVVTYIAVLRDVTANDAPLVEKILRSRIPGP